jgi:predicted Zn finger-like uncharacterized protein
MKCVWQKSASLHPGDELMPPRIVVCPQCGVRLAIAEDTMSGTDVRCPECNTVFAARAAGPSGFEGPTVAAGVSSDYSLDLGRIFNRGWNGFTQGLGMFVGVTVVGILLSLPVFVVVGLLSMVPLIGSLLGGTVNAAIVAPLWYGWVIVALAQLRGKPWSFGDIFGGFRFWVPVFVFSLIVNAFSWACTLPANICLLLAGSGNPLFYMLKGQRPPPPDPTLSLLGQLLNLVGVVILIIVSIRFFVMCPYLIIDRKCGAIDAIKANATLTKGHFFGWLGLSLLFGLIAGAGVLACCVGIFFTVPLCYCLMTSAYLEATSHEALAESET